jgi:hypothetical protein
MAAAEAEAQNKIVSERSAGFEKDQGEDTMV